MPDYTNRTFICSVLFLDIVEYSARSVAEQIRLKERFNAVLMEAITGVATDDRIILDTGDGAAVSFLGDPEDALFAGMSMRDAVVGEQELSGGAPRLQIRIGVNLGPVRLVKDINGQPNIIGDGINVAQRVMSFAEPGQILVSRSYYDVMARLSEDYSKLFHYEGAKTDKHVREHEVYAIGAAPSSLRRTLPPPAPKPAMRLPSFRIPKLPRLNLGAIESPEKGARNRRRNRPRVLARRRDPYRCPALGRGLRRRGEARREPAAALDTDQAGQAPGRVEELVVSVPHRDGRCQVRGGNQHPAQVPRTMTRYRWLPPVLACLALSGCASLGEDLAGVFSGTGGKELEFGVKAYEDGEYPYAARLLQASLDAGLRGRSKQARAHKFLAFIHCVSGRMQPCREEFRKALDIDPSFELSEDEAGHPVWGSVFRGVKSRK